MKLEFFHLINVIDHCESKGLSNEDLPMLWKLPEEKTEAAARDVF